MTVLLGPTRSKDLGGPPKVLKVTLLVMFVFPPNMVVIPIGASGSVGQMMAMLLMVIWLGACLFGIHKPWHFGHPGRAALICWVLASCAAYVALFSGLTGESDVVGRAAADRWMLLLFAGAGLTLMVTDTIRNQEDLMSVVRWLLAGAAFCCSVAVIQFFSHTNPMDVITSNMVGFTDNGSAATFQPRGNFDRVAGTTLHPIELGVVCSMLLPLAVWRALFDTRGNAIGRWIVVGLILLGNLVTVSRSGMIGLALALVVSLPFLPKLARRWAAIIIPPTAAAVFVAMPGMLTTLFDTASAGSSDSSITYRTDDYPLAWALVRARPLFGLGPGMWMPADPKNNFDNQYLLTAVTLGAIGLAAMVFYLLVPFFAAMTAALRTRSHAIRLLAASGAAAMLVATVASGTFDSMSFPVFALLVPIFVGLTGVAWRFSKQDRAFHQISSDTAKFC